MSRLPAKVDVPLVSIVGINDPRARIPTVFGNSQPVFPDPAVLLHNPVRSWFRLRIFDSYFEVANWSGENGSSTAFQTFTVYRPLTPLRRAASSFLLAVLSERHFRYRTSRTSLVYSDDNRGRTYPTAERAYRPSEGCRALRQSLGSRFPTRT